MRVGTYRNLCAEIALGGETKIIIKWVYIMEIVVYSTLFCNNTKHSIPYEKY
jgi:hypothetical protein